MLRKLIPALLLFWAGPAAAQEVLAQYATFLGPEDRVNSRGVPLGDFGAVLQQDRANFHRFGLRHDLDEFDTVFSDRAARSAIPALFAAGRPVEAYIFENVMHGRGHYVFVTIKGHDGRATHIDVYEGAG